MIWFSHETIRNIELLIILKIENWPIKSAGGIKGGDHNFDNSIVFVFLCSFSILDRDPCLQVQDTTDQEVGPGTAETPSAGR